MPPICRSWLASDSALKIAIAGKPAPTVLRPPICRSWLASDSALKIAIAGKPGSYGSEVAYL
jgi:hypothetical protein